MKDETPLDYNRTHDLTIEEIKASSTFAHVTDEQAKEIVQTLKTFSEIIHSVYQKEQQK